VLRSVVILRTRHFTSLQYLVREKESEGGREGNIMSRDVKKQYDTTLYIVFGL
jgi:hypothetical protein